MGSPLPNLIITEAGKAIETLRYWEATMTHGTATTSGLVSIPVGPMGVDLDVRAVHVTPGPKPAANAGNLLEIWAGAPGTVADVQTITMTASGGTFRVGFGGVFTAAQANNVATATLQAALVGLSTVGAGGVTVSGVAGTNYILTFAGPLANELMPMFQLDTSLLTGGSATIAHTTPGVGRRLVSRQVDANFTAYTPLLVTPGAFPHAAARIPNGTIAVVQATLAGDDSAAPTSLNVRLSVEIPYADPAARINHQNAYNRST